MRRLRPAPSLAPALALLILTASVVPAWSSARAAPPPVADRTIYVSADSAPGWLPSLEQEGSVRRSLEAYIAAVDGGRVTAAYAMLAPRRQLIEGPRAFAAWIADFHAAAGPVIARRVLRLTWTKDAPTAPLPGVYAAFDMANRFGRLDRHCSRIVLYQAPAGGDFQVAREEDTFLDNASADAIAILHSPADLDEAWRAMAAHCSNYDPEALDRAAGPTPLAGGPPPGP